MKKMNVTDKRSSVHKQSRDQLSGLSIMFLLGMAVNLIGLPSEVDGGAKIATRIFLILHGIIGLSLAIGAISVVARARNSSYAQAARIGLVTIVLTVVCGILTAITKSNWWSYAMAVGFLADFWIYGLLFIKTDKE